MRGTVGGRTVDRCLTRALDRSQRHFYLGVTAGRCQLLDGLALPVPTEKVHAPVRAGRIAAQHLFDEADRFDVLLPVERGTEAQTRNDVRHRGLSHTLTLVFAANHILGCGVTQRQMFVHGAPNRRGTQSVLANTMKHLDDERRTCESRDSGHSSFEWFLDPRDISVCVAPLNALGLHLVRQTTQVLQKRQLQHAGPGPELSDGQRGDALVALEETGQLLPIESTVAMAQDLQSDRVDANLAEMLSGGQRRQLTEVGPWQVSPNVGYLSCDEIEIIEEPLACGCNEPSGSHIFRQCAIRGAQDTRIVLESGKDVPRPASIRVDGEARRERQGTLFESFDAEEFVAKRLLGRP